MESITSAAEEVLVDSLSFKLPGSGKYVQERCSVTFHTEGSNSYSPKVGLVPSVLKLQPKVG